jgi:transcriptional regulator with XRE-family HTH domain
MPKLKDFNTIKKALLKRPGVRKEYEALEKEFQVAAEVIRARTRAHLTQAELARKIGTKKPAISRIESPGYQASIATLRKVADATDSELQIRIVPKSRRKTTLRKAARKRA